MKYKLPVLSAVVALSQGATQANFDTGGGARAQEMPVSEIIADQIRDQGYACNESLSAERDPTYSRPDEPVWILDCDNATYRVRLVPGMAADVERLDG
jgi:hypothetical protein